jgi:hypothetical protein
VRPSPYSTDRQDLSDAPIAARDRETTRAISRRFHRGIGFWLGGVILGAGGCLWGASMPYQHPVGVAISILWWGIFFGCWVVSSVPATARLKGPRGSSTPLAVAG